jgi:hydrogenase maturation protein HypF
MDEQSHERRTFLVRGIVQGVGFRPFVARLAESLGLAGSVRNRAGDVRIEVEGSCELVARFRERLELDAPALSRIDAVQASPSSLRGEHGFRILASDTDVAQSPLLTPDAATCDACVAELFEPQDRRYRYPFLACTDCGPRFTIVLGAPYDRERTTLRSFPLCELCSAEFRDPRSRRFHAQANACPVCGPALAFEAGALRSEGEAALAAGVAALRAGKVLAIKGIGGYHLACAASNTEAVARLRRRKLREAKPFALMVADVEAARALAWLRPADEDLLRATHRPIVLVERRTDADVAADVAPASPLLGIMLAYAPLQHLLLRDFGAPLVMTSGNVSHEPIAFGDDDARERLAEVADVFLTHNRGIERRCDDSLVRALPSGRLTLRRARGLAPEPITLAEPLVRPLLAVGGQAAVCFALGREQHVFVSHHIGDLDQHSAYRSYVDATREYQELFRIEPELVVHDLHPDYGSTVLAGALAHERGLPVLGVQHHHAHIASVMLEHGIQGPVIGVAFDGTGLGSDGSIWGGEFLLCERAAFERVAHLRPVPMPGGDRAVLEPWRMAVAYAFDAGQDAAHFFPEHEKERRAVLKLLERRAFCPASSGVGRLFDAVSALAGVCRQSSYDGQAAIELEWAAMRSDAVGRYDFALDQGSEGAPWQLDMRPLLRDVIEDLSRGAAACDVARRFHRTLVASVVKTCERLREAFGIARVVLGGGVFANALLVEGLSRALPDRGFSLYRPERYPPGDGSLALGQLAVAAALDSVRALPVEAPGLVTTRPGGVLACA